MAAYKHYDVLLVNAMFDGMNLVAKEGPIVNEREGVSILSENTGAHEELGEYALSVNPFDIQELADSIHAALTMAPRERRRRARRAGARSSPRATRATGSTSSSPTSGRRAAGRLTVVSPRRRYPVRRVAMTLPAPTYDLVLLLDPQAEEPARAKILADARAAIEAQGELLRHDDWGERALAYPIERKTERRVPPAAVPRRRRRAARASSTARCGSPTACCAFASSSSSRAPPRRPTCARRGAAAPQRRARRSTGRAHRGAAERRRSSPSSRSPSRPERAAARTGASLCGADGWRNKHRRDELGRGRGHERSTGKPDRRAAGVAADVRLEAARRALARASGGPGDHLRAGDRRAGGVGPVERRACRWRSALVVGGYALWTLFEYWLHRIVFHFEPEEGLGARMHWIIHGVHHDHPNDPLRLVMPPAVSVPLGAAVFGVLYLIFGARYAPGARRRLLRRLPGLRHDPLLPAPLPPARAARAGCCASGTCATTSRTTRAASGSARRTGTRSSAPPRARSEPRNERHRELQPARSGASRARGPL